MLLFTSFCPTLACTTPCLHSQPFYWHNEPSFFQGGHTPSPLPSCMGIVSWTCLDIVPHYHKQQQCHIWQIQECDSCRHTYYALLSSSLWRAVDYCVATTAYAAPEIWNWNWIHIFQISSQASILCVSLSSLVQACGPNPLSQLTERLTPNFVFFHFNEYAYHWAKNAVSLPECMQSR